MILDTLQNAHLYYRLGVRFIKAFEFLAQKDLKTMEKGKYTIDEHIFAMVNEYDTEPADNEQMEAHKKYIDVQYMVSGSELVGHDFLKDQAPSKAYDEQADFQLFAETPMFFSRFEEGMFAIFFPTDLHMPNIMVDKPRPVRKVVIKIAVE
ncbi:YhcH/YjgK/YiaL family protein [Chitinophaga terrae (ex Kim and Jung 2007)]|uniref:YhcH/YjgK/YiaL family protein n=1 Tax=Chitinophaga terrae (ex Kim and Jung 2007) TaxID=408074 RepID=UPI00278631B1|nr:YhcH/YjgK/YiaL family protein [Chitinophaga terrae (ex Kim and Jung 2007)]MDQ0106703.1 YhcH/YjgK/YiaL family protein [Chitinophaga terrae (ex Kim and Jung 2007)]